MLFDLNQPMDLVMVEPIVVVMDEPMEEAGDYFVEEVTNHPVDQRLEPADDVYFIIDDIIGTPPPSS